VKLDGHDVQEARLDLREEAVYVLFEVTYGSEATVIAGVVRHDVHGVGTDAFEAGDDVREGGLVVNAVRRLVREERVDLDVGRAGAGAVDVFLREGSDDLSVDATGVAEASHDVCVATTFTRVGSHEARIETTFTRVASHDTCVETTSVEGEADSLHGEADFLHGEDDPRAAYGFPTNGDATTCTGSVLP
jgi:hypothetical protein